MTDLWGPMFFKSACNTLKASRWKLWMARLFGQRHDGTDGEHRAIGYYYKGTFYLWDYRYGKVTQMIAETLTWVVLTEDAWRAATGKMPSPCRSQPYEQVDTIFCGKCVEVRRTLGL